MGGRVSCESSSTMGQSAVGCHLCWWLRWRSNRGGVYFILRGDFSSKFCFVDKSARARVGWTFDANRRAVGMLNPLRDKNEGFFIPGDRRGDTCYIPRRVQKGPEGKTWFYNRWAGIKHQWWWNKKTRSETAYRSIRNVRAVWVLAPWLYIFYSIGIFMVGILTIV